MNRYRYHKNKNIRNRLFVTSFLAVIFAFAAIHSIAQEVPKVTLLALSKANHTLSVVDPVSLKIIAKMPVGEDPHEVIASTDGTKAYVTNYGGGSLHELDVLDLVAQKALPSVDTRPLFGPHGIAFSEGKVWFSAEGSKAVGRLDPATGKIDWAMGTGQDRTHMVFVTNDEKRVYTTNVSSGTVSILVDTPMKFQGGPSAGMHPIPPPQGNQNGSMPPPPNGQPRANWEQTVIPVSKGSEGFDVSPDGKELWTAAANDGVISIIDLTSIKLSATVDAKILGANRLKFTPDGKRVLITSLSTGDLYIYDAATRTEIKHISTGHGAAGILVSLDGSRAFIGCSADNYVAIVDLKTLEVVDHLDVGGVPDGLAWAVRQ